MIYELTDIKVPNGPTFVTRSGGTDADVIREIWGENVYRVALGDCWGTVVDVGANIGTFSVFAALHGAHRVIAVEPEPDNAVVLGANIANYPHVQHRSVAIWGEAGQVTMTPNQGGTRVDEEGALTVPAITLAELFRAEQVTECSILKMDIEGSEYPVIASAPREILQRIHYLTMEFHATDAATFGAMVAKLTETHCVQTLGSYERGGYIFARRY